MKILVASSNPHKIEEIRAMFTECNSSESPPDSSPDSPPESPPESPPKPTALRRGLPTLETPPKPSSDGNVETVELVSLSDLGLVISEPVEDEPTFEGNALKKARYYAQASGMLCLADDSGLEVDALGGEPGVRSARYAGVSGPRAVVDPANNKLLLQRLESVPAVRRTARFVCAMALSGSLPWENSSSPARGAATNLVAGQWPGIVVRGTVEGRILLPEECADPTQPWRGRGSSGFGYDPLFYFPERGQTTAELSAADKNAISHRGNASRLMWKEIARLCAGR